MPRNTNRVNCEGCKERCRCSLLTPKSDDCLLADSIAGTGAREQLNIRAAIALMLERDKNKSKKDEEK